MLIRAPAKVNLWLRVGRRRRDGYHSIVTLFHSVGLADRLRLLPAKTLSFAATGIPSPAGSANLAVRAALLLRDATGCRKGARIQLSKRIPAGAGLGGGSADAAAVLAGLNRLWRLRLPRSRLLPLAARLGSDVPFCLSGGAAVGTGRGERLRAVRSRLDAWAVLVKPGAGVPTRDAYRDLDRLAAADRPRPAAPLARAELAVRRGDLAGLAVHNDFEPVVFARLPRLVRLKDALLAAGAHPAFMTGSGSALVGLFPSRAPALAAARSIGRISRVWSVATRLKG